MIIAAPSRRGRSGVTAGVRVAAVLLAAGACACVPPPPGDAPAAGLGVSARHAFRTHERSADIFMTEVDGTTALAWREGGRWRVRTSADGGRTFAEPTGGSADAVTVRPPAALTPTHVAGDTWRVSGKTEWREHGGWTLALPRLAAGSTPIAVDEYCGLVAVASVESFGGGVALKVRRFLPPLRARSGAGLPIGGAIDVGLETALAAPAMVAVPDAVLLAWRDQQDVRVVRVELPGALCGGRLSWTPFPTFVPAASMPTTEVSRP